jgi:hypothetical protein
MSAGRNYTGSLYFSHPLGALLLYRLLLRYSGRGKYAKIAVPALLEVTRHVVR